MSYDKNKDDRNEFIKRTGKGMNAKLNGIQAKQHSQHTRKDCAVCGGAKIGVKTVLPKRIILPRQDSKERMKKYEHTPLDSTQNAMQRRGKNQVSSMRLQQKLSTLKQFQKPALLLREKQLILSPPLVQPLDGDQLSSYFSAQEAVIPVKFTKKRILPFTIPK